MKLVVGLGNPGKEYVKTRHNAGFFFLDSIIKKYNLSLNKNKFNGNYCEMIVNGEKVIFLEPQTYMNLSGSCVEGFANYYKIDSKDILVIHDDLDLPIGKVRIRFQSDSGGHNGIKDIINKLNTKEFKRIRIGIGKDSNIPVIDYVIGNFSDSDIELLKEKIDLVYNVVNDFINGQDFQKIVSRYN